MPLLYFWRGDHYERDLAFGVVYHLNQANPPFLAFGRAVAIKVQSGLLASEVKLAAIKAVGWETFLTPFS
jgi:hypothetical protein